jgi:16S rRNA (guanine966-N2)-methyltransferase
MRIIAGSAGRRAIKVPAHVTRPTTDFVRQAMFSILGEKVVAARVLDLYAGSGAIGLEALSRGASSCVWVDDHRQAVATITRNLAATGLTGGRAVCADAAAFLRRDRGTYDLIFADPPYCKHPGDPDPLAALLTGELLGPRLADGGWFIAETAASHASPGGPGWDLRDRREYGGSAILLYARTAAI